MKCATTVIASVLSLALATGAMAGCGGQQPQQAAEPEATNQTAAAPEQSQEELLAEFKTAMDNVPACTSVTAEEEMDSTLDGEAPLVSKTVYKFDESGDQVKTSVEAEMSGIKLAYYSDGDDAVVVTDGPVYAGTTEQLNMTYASGLQSLVQDRIGDVDALIDCASNVEKITANGINIYVLTLDVDKYIATDEALQAFVESGTTLKEAVVSISFDQDQEGAIGSIDKKMVYEGDTAEWHVIFRDYNKTTIDQMPEATATYDEMLEDEQAKLDAMLGLEAEANATEANATEANATE